MQTAAAPPVPSLDQHTELAARVAQLEARMARAPDPDGMTLLVFSGDLDKLLAAFTIANGAAATGMSVRMFFTFWGAAALKARTVLGGKSLVERAFGLMLPGGLTRRALSRMDMLGVGRRPWALPHLGAARSVEGVRHEARCGTYRSIGIARGSRRGSAETQPPK